jgi:PHP family Zn ribbon phosphoesterase
MSPDRIADEGLARGLSVMALTDHNSCLNTPPFVEHCRRRGILGIPGAEITSAEEVHILALFYDAETALEFGRLLWESLPPYPHDPDKFGDQVQVDTENNILSTPDRYLVSATTLTTTEIVGLVHQKGGLVIPAHIDRPYFSLISQLGFLPDEPFDAVEITRLPAPPGAERWPVTASSDAHYPEDIGTGYINLEMENLTFLSLKKALSERSLSPIPRKKRQNAC